MECSSGYVKWESERICEPFDMPTAIVRIYTTEGFVIGADGREYEPTTRTIIRENVRKIFSVPGKPLTYAISGSNMLTLTKSGERFDVLPTIHEIVKTTQGQFDNLKGYCVSLARSFADLPERNLDEPTILYFDGYLAGKPQQAKIKIHHDGTEPEWFPEELNHGFPGGCGSQVIHRMLNRWRGVDAGLIEKYRPTTWDVPQQTRTLSQSIEVAQSVLYAHCSPEAQELDPKNCAAIGGIAHLCINRPGQPFEWMFRDPQTKIWNSCAPPTGATIP